jgi:hypothetical protein
MSDSTENETLCERCRLFSFNDLAIGGREVVREDGAARLSFLESRIEFRPEGWLESRDLDDILDYRLVRLEWELDDALPDMPLLSRSSQLGCALCQALRNSLEETLEEEAKLRTGYVGVLHLLAYLALADGGIEGLVVEATFNEIDQARIMFPIEASSSKLYHPSEFQDLQANY